MVKWRPNKLSYGCDNSGKPVDVPVNVYPPHVQKALDELYKQRAKQKNTDKLTIKTDK